MLVGMTFQPATAATKVEKKLGQFGGPETRTRCIKELKTKGLPSCKVKSWKLKCKDSWVYACTEWATDLKQHELYLTVTGPDAPTALKIVLKKAVDDALLAAASAFAATPGEVVIRAAAAVKAFDTTFAAALAVEPALASMRNNFQIGITERHHW